MHFRHKKATINHRLFAYRNDGSFQIPVHMAKKFTWFAILLTGMLLSGCSKDKTPPEVIESTVQNSGMDDKVKVETNAKGTSLTYKSWVVVDQVFATRTAAAGEEAVVENRAAGKGTEISVLLTNRLKHSVDTAGVEHYKLALEPAVTLERRIGETYAEGILYHGRGLDSGVPDRLRLLYGEVRDELPGGFL